MSADINNKDIISAAAKLREAARELLSAFYSQEGGYSRAFRLELAVMGSTQDAVDAYDKAVASD